MLQAATTPAVKYRSLMHHVAVVTNPDQNTGATEALDLYTPALTHKMAVAAVTKKNTPISIERPPGLHLSQAVSFAE
jgi:hypothetical protein